MISGIQLDEARRVRAELPVTELHPEGDTAFEERVLPLLMSEEVSPLFADDFEQLPPVYLVSIQHFWI